jgi:hypothetical protein
LGGKSNPFYIRRTNQNLLLVKKNLLAFFSLCVIAISAKAQGTYVNVIINGNDPSCGIVSVIGFYYTGADSANVNNVTFQMAGAVGVYGALLPVEESAMLTICVQPSANCGFTTCVNQLVYPNTANSVLINLGNSVDADQDGFTIDTDCDDNNPFVNPAMEEICGDFADNNCDGSMDEGCTGGMDMDNDGFAYTVDCNDFDATVYPGAMEICGDSIDNNCNILMDEGCNEGPIDFDMDGYYSNSDCNDNDYLINPGVPEFCADSIDNNCNGVVDEEGCSGNPFDCNPDIILLTDSTSYGSNPGAVYILNNIPLVGVYSYFWDFGDGNTSNSPFPTNYYETSGTYTICLTAAGNGCTGTTCITFTVTPNGGFLPGGMPMTGFTLNVISATPTNVEELAAETILEAYPCPFRDELTLNIQSELPGNAVVSCYDMTGSLISQEQFAVSNQRNTYSLATDSWSSGAYTIVVSTPSGTSRRVVMK